MATRAVRAAEIAGAIDANGHRQVKPPKYTVSHPGVGRCVITFSTPSPAPYATCLFMPNGNIAPSGLTESTTKCDVTFVDNAGKLVNTLFNFIAVDTTD